MNNMMSGVNQSIQDSMAPPLVPVTAYNVAVNGHAAGPFELYILKQIRCFSWKLCRVCDWADKSG